MMAELKTRPTGGDVAAFINGIADTAVRQDCLTLVDIMRRVVGAEPEMWGSTIVGFGGYHYRYASIRTARFEWLNVAARLLTTAEGAVLRLTDVPEVRRRYERFQTALPRA